MKICRPRPQLVFTFDNRFSSTGCAAQQSARYIIFRLQASYSSATSHTGRESCRVKSLYMKRFWFYLCHYFKLGSLCSVCTRSMYVTGLEKKARVSIYSMSLLLHGLLFMFCFVFALIFLYFYLHKKVNMKQRTRTYILKLSL